MADDLRAKALGVRTALFGEEAARRRMAEFDQFDEGFGHVVNDVLFGEIWTRPGLPIKTRSMITITALMVLGRGPELRTHMRGALNLGITAQELREMIIHLSQYAGIPIAVEAIRAFNEVVGERK
jgi:4-carboxymuconolactone decarboxylase